MKFYKLFVRLSHFCFTFLKKLTSFLDAFHSGFWLGALGKKGIAYSDELHYRKNTIYVKDEYNEKGLYDWEQYIVENHFADVKTIMLIAAARLSSSSPKTLLPPRLLATLPSITSKNTAKHISTAAGTKC